MSTIKRINETYATMDDVRRLVNYCENSEYFYKRQCFGTNPLNTECTLNSMERVKRMWHKREGNQIHHLVFCFQSRKELKERTKLYYAEDVLYTVGNYLDNKGFQSIGYIHMKQKEYCYGYAMDIFDNIHMHLIINSVNGFTGLKLTGIQSFLKDILSMLNREYPNLNWDMILYK